MTREKKKNEIHCQRKALRSSVFVGGRPESIVKVLVIIAKTERKRSEAKLDMEGRKQKREPEIRSFDVRFQKGKKCEE